MIVCAGGNLMYTLADSKWFLLGARIVAGAGGAIDAVTYGYATRVVKHTNIARLPCCVVTISSPPHCPVLTPSCSSMANLRGSFGVGQVLAPLLGYVFSATHVNHRYGRLRLDVYTLPSFVTALLCLAFVPYLSLSIKELPRTPSSATPQAKLYVSPFPCSQRRRLLRDLVLGQVWRLQCAPNVDGVHSHSVVVYCHFHAVRVLCGQCAPDTPLLRLEGRGEQHRWHCDRC
jgi:MFS family permease